MSGNLYMDGIDIRNDFAAVVDGISNFDAIRLGLMPQFTYRIGVPDKDLSSYRERIYKESQNIRKRQNVITGSLYQFYCKSR